MAFRGASLSWSPEVITMAEAEPVTPAQAQPVIVTLPAEIALANADSIGKQLAGASGPGVAVGTADVTATTFCGSVGMRMLLARRQAVTAGTGLRLVPPWPPCLARQEGIGVDAVLPIYRNLDEALSGLAVTTGGP
jgi:anti-anti-sigma regulatory factor